MYFTLSQQHKLKRASTWVLVLFVVSWVNLSMQSPAHAVMQQSMQAQTMQMDNMLTMDMQDCHCPPVLCDAVASTDHQSVDGSFSSISLNNMLVFLPRLSSRVLDEHQSQVSLRLRYLNQQYHQTSPPPISITSTLLI